MSLSNYQGTSMTIHYARKNSNPAGLSQTEISLLRKKYKNNPKKLEEINKRTDGKEIGNHSEKNNKKKMIEDCKKINQRHSKQNEEWHSVQEKSNQIALQCLGKYKGKN